MDEKSEKMETIDLTKISNPILKEMVEVGLITQQGVRMQGMGLVVRKLEDVAEMIDKTNLKLYNITRDINRVMEKMGIDTKFNK